MSLKEGVLFHYTFWGWSSATWQFMINVTGALENVKVENRTFKGWAFTQFFFVM